MARYRSANIVSQTAQLAGAPVTTTVNGYVGYLGASATAGFKLRRLGVGVRTTAGSPTSQQVTLAVYRQTVTPSGTGLAAAIVGVPLETWTLQTDPTAGFVATTATTIGTTGPTLGSVAVASITFNTQTYVDHPVEFIEELICPLGATNGFGFVLLGLTLPAAHLAVLDVEYEV